MNHKRHFSYCLVACGVVMYIGMNFGPEHLQTSMLKYIIRKNITFLRSLPSLKVNNPKPPLFQATQSSMDKDENILTRVFMTTTFPSIVKTEPTTSKPVASTPVTHITNIPKNATSSSKRNVMPTENPPTNISPLRFANYSLCTNFIGGLGNQMFMFAAIFGLAARKGMSVTVGKTDYLTKVFKLDINLKDNNKALCKTYVGRGERLNCGYDEKMASFPPNNNYRLGTYLQSWKYFYNASSALRKQFVFQDDIVESKNKVIDSILKRHNFTSRSNVTFIGIHVRRGDFVNHRFGYMVASEDYLTKAIDYFRSKEFKNPVFLTCSNDMKWTQAHIPKGVRLEYIKGNSAAVDLAILGSCDHMISTVGTFSWWAAWLTGGEVTFYQWPAKEGSGLRKQFSKDYRDYFHPGWIGFS
ncbi:galactoside alpha-(1,2)-fucosyltransferase 2-like [Ylistrum balloti]|uniref:galactoside alpha-(1,2)-fucosyltransferase 2-like n=1 Tax=Ylistrum balloti TaxID=509963 RepID=UPI00290582DB|nr:galactoside alpha-(1,2)-fucosyltransferase 2-like [Ylistrum balloti]